MHEEDAVDALPADEGDADADADLDLDEEAEEISKTVPSDAEPENTED